MRPASKARAPTWSPASSGGGPGCAICLAPVLSAHAGERYRPPAQGSGNFRHWPAIRPRQETLRTRYTAVHVPRSGDVRRSSRRATGRLHLEAPRADARGAVRGRQERRRGIGGGVSDAQARRSWRGGTGRTVQIWTAWPVPRWVVSAGSAYRSASGDARRSHSAKSGSTMYQLASRLSTRPRRCRRSSAGRTREWLEKP